jgi:MFS family permease
MMKRFRWYDHLSINLYWLGMNIRNTAIGSVFMPYLVDMFVKPEVKNTSLGAMRAAGLIIAMLVQPAAGLLSDRNTSRFGRRRPYIFVGVLFDLLFLALIALSGSYWMLFIVLLFQQFSANVSHGPLQGLIPDLVPENQRGRSSGVKALFELIPLIVIPFTIAKLVSNQQVGMAAVVTGGILLLTMLLTMLLVKEKPLTEKPSASLREPMLRVLGMLGGILAGGAAGFLAGGLLGGLAGLITWLLAGKELAQVIGFSLGGAIAMIVAVVVGVWGGALATLGNDARRNSSFTWWVVNRLFFLAGVTSIQGFATYFLMSAFKVTREVGVKMNADLMMVVGLCTLISALLGGFLSDKFSVRKMVGIAGVAAVAGTMVLLVTTVIPNLTVMYVAGIIIGLGAGLFMTTNWALGTELAPPAEAGRYLGISNLAGAGAGMIGAGIGGLVADRVSLFFPGMGYLVIFTCYALLFTLSAISLVKVRKAQL